MASLYKIWRFILKVLGLKLILISGGGGGTMKDNP